MNDLISRQAAIDAVYERIKQIGYENSLSILSIGQVIRDLPSAQPPYQYSEAYVHQIRGERDILQDMVDNMAKPKTGAWIGSFDGNECYWYCNRCKTKWYEEDLYMGGNEFPKFCPECGSEMHDCTTCKNMESDTGFCYEIADSDTHECHYERKE